MSGIELPEPERATTGEDHGDRDAQIAALIEVIGRLSNHLTTLENRVTRLARTAHDAAASPGRSAVDENQPAAWVWFSPPAASADDDNPRDTVAHWIAWYNVTYVGAGRATPIPNCWDQHPGLAQELAALAHSWRAANLGTEANVRDAQHWHHVWRPGAIERLTRDWTHPDCLDGEHHDTGAAPRANRHTINAEPGSGPRTPDAAGPRNWGTGQHNTPTGE